MKNIFEVVQEVLSSNNKYLSEDNQLLKAKVYTDVMTMDKGLLTLLLSNKRIEREFFTRVKDTLVFDKQKFAWLIESKEFLPDSYTRYSNKIGLSSDGNFISQKNDVVLDFPYKDCFLKGGQDKEEQKREEIFYHETIASDEVTRMLEPKIFTNAKRYTGGDKEEDITFDEKDNLIIKGNNLIALSSLLKRYEGKVKCIYIDPPYYFQDLKEYDAFKYNSNFKLSTWLVFLKNRLQIAKKLLADDGSVWVHVGEEGMHYLKILMDDIFGAGKFVGTIPRKTREGKNDVPFNFSQDFDFILVYTRGNKSDAILNRKINRKYIETPDFPGRPWRRGDIKQQKNYLERPNSYFEMINPKTGKKYPVDKDAVWRVTKDTFEEWYSKGYIGFPDDYDFMTGNQPFRRSFKDEDEKKEKGASVFSDFLLKEFIQQIMGKGKTSNKDLVNELEFNYAKPETLMKAIIEVATFEGDIVLDFFLGSGTTSAVAHKMSRQYIGIEQMDYIENVTLERLSKVIEGEQGGVSKDVNWKGGGSFVYCELLENSHELIKEIQGATNNTIDEIKETIYKDERIVPYITRIELEKTDRDFEELNLEDKKKALIALVDKNKLYVNLSDIEDETYGINDEDRRFTESFYKEED